MTKFLLVCIIMMLSFNCFAVVSVIDDNVVAEELSAVKTYVDTIKGYMARLSSTSDSLSQLTDLHQLIVAQQRLATTCDKYCSQAEMDKVHQYLSNLNASVSGQFKAFAGIIDANINNLDKIEQYINGFSGNIKEVGVALQKASEQVQVQTENTLLQMQSLISLDIENREANIKLEKINSNALSSGFAHPGF